MVPGPPSAVEIASDAGAGFSTARGVPLGTSGATLTGCVGAEAGSASVGETVAVSRVGCGGALAAKGGLAALGC